MSRRALTATAAVEAADRAVRMLLGEPASQATSVEAVFCAARRVLQTLADLKIVQAD